jgi:hypothetical protein
VHGQYVQNTTGLDGAKRVNAGDIDCITLIGTNTALVSGTIRRHTIPELIGLAVVFFVVDNGAGSSGTPDQVGSLSAFPPGEEDCTDLRLAGGDPFSIESGNVLV